MTADQPPKPCRHPRAKHQHGTALAYQLDGCRCSPCRVAGRRNRKSTEYRTLTRTHSYVPADQARAHVRQLLEVLTVSQVEQRSGVHRTAIRVLVGDFPGRPASKRITRRTEAALLAVTDDRIGAERQGLVDGAGTRRRVRALVALGWPVRHLQALLPLGDTPLQRVVRPGSAESDLVRVTTRDAVRTLYDQLSLTSPPPSRAATRARNLASARGWLPPLAWDDDAIDDPHAVPATEEIADVVDEHAVALVVDGQPMTLTGRDLEAAVEQLTARGLDAPAIAARCRSDETTVRRARNTVQQRKARAAARAEAVA